MGLSRGWALCSGPTHPEKALGQLAAGLRLSAAGRGLRGWRICQDLSRLPGIKSVAETLSVFSSLPPIPRGPLPFAVDPFVVSVPLQAWESLPSPRCPSGAPVLSCLHFSSPLTAPQVLSGRSGVPPITLGVQSLPPVPGRCPSCEET